MKTENRVALDDADTLETDMGAKTITHGIAVDTFSRTVPTHILPYHVRNTLFRAYPGMDGTRLSTQMPENFLPWYDYTTADNGATQDSVASELTVTVGEAELWNPDDFSAGETEVGAGNRFANYADLPFNPATIARHAFWKYDDDAAELDPAMAFEPQVYALDCATQLYVESCAFHFGYLADVDAEYHRLREGGPLGRFDLESSQLEPWYRLYHHWRNEINTHYIETGYVRLPELIQAGNWKISDVLRELYLMMEKSPGALHDDIILTQKGYVRGLTGITLGIQDDVSMHDGDGNVRFYHPLLQYATNTTATTEVVTPRQLVPYSVPGDDGAYVPGAAPSDPISVSATGATAVDTIDISQIWDLFADASSFPEDGSVYSHFFRINPVPTGGTMQINAELQGELGNVASFNYWSGHTLNLYELIQYMRFIGNAVEPEVITKLIMPMGRVTDTAAVLRKPSAVSARHMDELYNLYLSAFSFNENPARTYTAAHMGPTSHILGEGDLNLGGVPLRSTMNGVDVTVRERYWTPATITGGTMTEIVNAFLPNVVLEGNMFNRLAMADLFNNSTTTMRDLVSRMLGSVGSMRTKVERPVLLPAGKSGEDAVYASGMGEGAIELVMELVYSIAGGRPRFGLGHGGFSDISGTTAVVDGQVAVFPVNRASATENLQGVLLSHSPLITDPDQPVTQFIGSGGGTELAIDPDLSIDYTSWINSVIQDVTTNLGTVGRHVADDEETNSASTRFLSPYWSKIGGGASALLTSGTSSPVGTFSLTTKALPTYVEYGFAELTDTGLANEVPADHGITGLFWPNAPLNYADASNPPTATAQGQFVTSSVGAAVANDTMAGTNGRWFVPMGIILALPGDGPNGIGRSYQKSFISGVTAENANSLGFEIHTGLDYTAQNHFTWDFNTLSTKWNGDLAATQYDVDERRIVTTYSLPDSVLSGTSYYPHIAPGVGQIDNQVTAGVVPTMYQATPTSNVEFTPGSSGFNVSGVTSAGYAVANVRYYCAMSPSELVATAGLELATLAGLTDAEMLEAEFLITVGVFDGISHITDIDGNSSAAGEIGAGPLAGMNITTDDIVRPYGVAKVQYSYSLRPAIQGLSSVSARCDYTPPYNVGDGEGENVDLDITAETDRGYLIVHDYNNVSAVTSRGLGTVPASDWWAGVTAWHTPIDSGAACLAVNHGRYALSPGHPMLASQGEWGSVDLSLDLENFKNSVNWTLGSRYPGRVLVGDEDDYLVSRGGVLHPTMLPGSSPLLYMGPTASRRRYSVGTAHNSGIRWSTLHNGSFMNPSRSTGNTDIVWNNSLDLLSEYSVGVLTDHQQLVMGQAGTGGTSPVAASLLGGTSASGARYVYPDDPKFKMIYRPWRNIADASVLRELKMLFANDGEDPSFTAGPLGIKVLGTSRQFRFADLVDAGQPETFILEKATSKTRLIDPSYRSVLTFSKSMLLDPSSGRHTIPDVIREFNSLAQSRRFLHSNDAAGSKKIYTREMIRDLQLGRQYIRRV